MTETYDAAFYDGINPGSAASAAVIVPDIMRMVEPTSVIDVGAGSGAWAREFSRHVGRDHVTTLDGPWAANHLGQLHEWTAFVECDLGTERFSAVLPSDLAVCLEVAEHIDGDRADGLVEDLCNVAPVILFSAAVPGQPGTHHVNCQPPTYWRDKFGALGYTGSGALRRRYWNRPDVEWWYQQNLLIFWRSGHQPMDLPEIIEPDDCPYVVHPVLYDYTRNLP